MIGKLVDVETEGLLFDRLIVADNFLSRAVGLIGKRSLPRDEAMLIQPCSSIHTCAMRMNLDVAFCDRDGVVLGVARDVRPWRFKIGPRGSRIVIEWQAGNGPKLEVGQKIRVVPDESERMD